jgi:hypothetical protein
MSVRRSLNQYSSPGWWKSSADFSDLDDLNMGEGKPLYPFGSNPRKTRVHAAAEFQKQRKASLPVSARRKEERTH